MKNDKVVNMKNDKNNFDIKEWNINNNFKNKDHEVIITKLKGENKEIIKITDVKKSFGTGNKRKEILHGLSFDIRENENIAIIGSNGAGKTTIVEIIAGINKYDSGKIEYLYKWNKTPMEKIGIQFQNSSYPLGITTKEIISFYSTIFDCSFSKDELNMLIEIFGINEFLNKSAHSLSGGQLQRINALLSIVHIPKVVFLDEISTGLDIQIRNKIKKFIKEFAAKNNMSIILVSHDTAEIEYIADRIIVLIGGKIVVSMYKDEVIQKFGNLDNFISKYI